MTLAIYMKYLLVLTPILISCLAYGSHKKHTRHLSLIETPARRSTSTLDLSALEQGTGAAAERPFERLHEHSSDQDLVSAPTQPSLEEIVEAKSRMRQVGDWIWTHRKPITGAVALVGLGVAIGYTVGYAQQIEVGVNRLTAGCMRLEDVSILAQQQCSALFGKTQVLESKIGDFSNHLGNCSSSASMLLGQTNQLQTQADLLGNQLGNCSHSVATLLSQTNQLQTQVDVLSNQLTGVTQQLTNCSNSIPPLLQGLSRCTDGINSCSQAVTSCLDRCSRPPYP